MAQSDTLDLSTATSRKRLRSLIDPEGIRDAQQRRDNSQAFHTILELYVDNLTIFPIQSFFARDEENPDVRRHWTADTAIVIADVELAAECALKHDQKLLDLFWKWFVLPEIETITYEKLSAQDSRLQGQIIQRCGREFLRRGIYPIHRYFRMPQQNTRPRAEKYHANER
jgi:hypothetical protein